MNHRSGHLTASRRPAARGPQVAAVVRTPLDRSLQTFPPESHTDLVRRRGGLISIPRRLVLPPPPAAAGLAKLLLNVTVERSLGPVQVVMAQEKSVRDLIRASVEAYGKEKRRPLLRVSDPRCFELHYSPFSLECLRPEEKLISLGSRNFFLCTKRSTSSNSSCSEEASGNANAPFALTYLMDFLL
ncbi:uncharacterized protein LOC115746520 [Rhodamnia argentea]|uniref:Uncharacterized protein LOC115746520 n=1 Tax=Rhodamnia argentea TaxID=178133 RepID=A0A8B8PTS8_9MYRT|nr:uncharacterized protein LOC115746520 [Rhodamnia argentea]